MKGKKGISSIAVLITKFVLGNLFKNEKPVQTKIVHNSVETLDKETVILFQN